MYELYKSKYAMAFLRGIDLSKESQGKVYFSTQSPICVSSINSESLIGICLEEKEIPVNMKLTTIKAKILKMMVNGLVWLGA